METFGNTLKRLRGSRTLRDIERLTGVKNGNLSLMERGRSYPSPATLKILSQHLGFSFDIAAAMIAQERANKEGGHAA